MWWYVGNASQRRHGVFPAPLPTGSVFLGKLFPPLQALSPMCKWVTGLDTEVPNGDKWWLQEAEEFSVGEGETKLSSERIRSFYGRLKSVGGGQGAQRASLGEDSKSHYQWRLLVLRKTQPKLTAVHVALFPGLCIFWVQGSFLGFMLYTHSWMPYTCTGTSAVVYVVDKSTNKWTTANSSLLL